MVATLTRGYTWSVNGTVTNVTLHQLVDNATIAGIDQTNLDSSFSGVTISATAPVSPFTGQLWFDTTAGILKYWNGTAWSPVGKGDLFTNKSGGSLATGDVVIVDTTTDQSVTTTSSAKSQLVIGTVLDPTLASNAQGVVLVSGLMLVNVTGSTTRGQFLQTSTTVKKADPVSAPTIGTFAIALTASSTQVLAIAHTPPGLSGTSNTQAALDGAASPSSTNVFATIADTDYASQIFTSNGTFTATKTGGHKITVVGGGGGGGGDPGTPGGGGGGGGAGIVYQSLTSGTGYAVTVGAAGAASANNNSNGGTGGNSVFAGTATVTAAGGVGGTKNGGAGGAGGAVTNGTISITGGVGRKGAIVATLGGDGGMVGLGIGTPGIGGLLADPSAVTGYGAGGGGGANSGVGFAGGAGVVIVEYVG